MNAIAVNKGISLALLTPKSVCYISNNTYSASFDSAKEGKIRSATGDEGGKGKRKGRGRKGQE